MNENQLTKQQQEAANDLKYYSLSAETNINNAIDEAENPDDLIAQITDLMTDQADEAFYLLDQFSGSDDSKLKYALAQITGEKIEEVEENAGSIWYRVDDQWHFVMTAECDK